MIKNEENKEGWYYIVAQSGWIKKDRFNNVIKLAYIKPVSQYIQMWT